MKQDTIDTGKGKIQKICDVLKNETIEPARQEAAEIIENAHMQAQEIIEVAQKQAEKLHEDAVKKIEEEKKVFEASLSLSKKQSIDSLKQAIEEKLFDKPLEKLISNASAEPKLIRELIQSFLRVIEEKGFDTDLSVYIPKTVSVKAVNELIGAEILENLREKSVEIGNFHGGIKIALHENEITLDFSDEALKELIAKYARKSFRETIFKG